MPISEGEISLPDNWHSNIEKSKEKARKMLKKVVAVDLNTSILIGILEDVTIDRLFRLKYPFCKLTISRVKKYDINEKLEGKEEEQVCFVNKPQMILDMNELAKKFPEIFEDVHVEMKKGAY
jgi:hypothetical protein